MLEHSGIIFSGRYRLLQCLHKGGMSEVFLAFDERAQQHVAIKLVTSDYAEYRKRLQREIGILRKLSHPHILPLLDAGIADSYHYLVMPYMRRGNLRERLKRGALMPQEAGNILTQLAEALQYAHKQGIIHRDIKPSNVLLDTTEADHVYLADFGLAKPVEGASDITQVGCLIGTPQYMAPELADKPYSVSSDIYALGIMLYQMLTGQLPFTGTDPLTIYWKHMQEQPAAPSILNPKISYAVEQVILRALAKDPRQRFPDAQAMARAYANALKMNALSRPLSTLDMLALPPVQVTLRKREMGSGVAFSAGFWQKHTGRTIQKGILIPATLVLLVLPLSLGLVLARDIAHSSTPLSISTALENKIAPSTQPAPPTRTPSPSQTNRSVDAGGALPEDTTSSGPKYGPLPKVSPVPKAALGHKRGGHRNHHRHHHKESPRGKHKL